MSALECAKLLMASRLAHLACAEGSRPYVVPIYYAYVHHHLYGFSMPGRKVDCMRRNPNVCVQVDECGKGVEWKSVVVQGRYQELDDSPELIQEREHAWRLLSKIPIWWEPGSLKLVEQAPEIADHYDHVFFRVLVDEITGREARYS